MFITVRFGDDQKEIFNPHSRIHALLDNIKERCECEKDDVIDLSDLTGTRKNLQMYPKDYAIKYMDERDVLILIRIERFPGSLNESCVPLLHDLQGNKEFLANLNKNLKDEPNSEQKPAADRGPKRGTLGARRASMNLRKQNNTLTVGAGGKKNRASRSQSVAFSAGTTSLLKSPRR